MLTYIINDMTCGHCVSSITKAVQAIEPHAKVTADLANKRVTIEDAHVDTTLLSDAMKVAGYTPVLVPTEA